MLPRALLRTPRQSQSNGLAKVCLSGQCQSTSLLSDLPIRLFDAPARCTPGTRRTIKLGRAPSILRKQKQAKAQTVKHDRSQQDEQEAAALLQLSLDFLIRIKAVTATKQQLLGFYIAFEQLIEHIRDGKDVDLASFRDAQKTHGLQDEDCMALAQAMSLYRSRVLIRSWMYLRQLLSLAAYLPATLWSVGSLLESARKDQSKLRSPEARYPLEHLRSVAQAPDGDFRAKTLLGRVENLLGNEANAIKLLTQAMQAVRDAPASENAERSQQSPLSLERMYQLDAPYLDLARIHSIKTQRAAPENDAYMHALNVGCESDDPMSYYDRAVYLRNIDTSKPHGFCSRTWLRDMTKAAASGHPKAMFDLSQYYAQQAGEPIEKKPLGRGSSASLDTSLRPAQASLASQVGQFFGVASNNTPHAASEISQSAAFPSNAPDHVKLAHDWGVLAINKGYPPATIHLAKLHLAESQPSVVDAQKTASRPEDPQGAQTSKASNRGVQTAGDGSVDKHKDSTQPVTNPHYDVAAAQKYLQKFFSAERTLALRQALHESDIKHPRGPSAPQDSQTSAGERERQVFAEQPQEVRHWWANRQVLELCEDEMGALGAEARQICDANDFTIYDSNDALMYRGKGAHSEKPTVKSGRAAAARV